MELNNRLDYFVGEGGPHTGNTVGLGNERISSLNSVVFLFLDSTPADTSEGYHEGSLEK